MKKIKTAAAAAAILMVSVILWAKVGTESPGKYDEVIKISAQERDKTPEKREPEKTPTAVIDKKKAVPAAAAVSEKGAEKKEPVITGLTAEELIKRITESQERRKALKTKIEIVSKDFTYGGVQRIIGEVLIKKEDKFRIHYTEPAEQILVSDGKMLWMYVPMLNQVIRQEIEKANMDMQFYIEIESSIGFFAKYSDTKIEEKEDHYVLIMIPRDRKKIDYQEITVKTGKEEHFPFYMSIKDENMFIHVDFSDVKAYTAAEAAKLEEFNDSNFVFEIPEGADVIEGSELMGI